MLWWQWLLVLVLILTELIIILWFGDIKGHKEKKRRKKILFTVLALTVPLVVGAMIFMEFLESGAN